MIDQQAPLKLNSNAKPESHNMDAALHIPHVYVMASSENNTIHVQQNNTSSSIRAAINIL
eukprot:CAMPEP_0198121948 /NCGR_PEP_ID=MMETSP1442-20131203/33504_1 /TAXON_ID= /ORGANISM="Craspedostauros australis, Strain CCMP3328" /LENGTH=59 /DNA_ID=CAMNT_0043780857 /DNA_START=380 /DNA_END=557 /DNA_ORIENTATION=-